MRLNCNRFIIIFLLYDEKFKAFWFRTDCVLQPYFKTNKNDLLSFSVHFLFSLRSNSSLVLCVCVIIVSIVCLTKYNRGSIYIDHWEKKTASFTSDRQTWAFGIILIKFIATNHRKKKQTNNQNGIESPKFNKTEFNDAHKTELDRVWYKKKKRIRISISNKSI